MRYRKSIISIHNDEIVEFRKKVRSYYRKNKRDFPFRSVSDPYKITVSELMLQQTQVDRVVPYYQNWIAEFPNWYTLYQASNHAVLKAWSGLGYNRRAMFLKKIASEITVAYNGNFPDDVNEMLKLPGIGRYTAHAIAVFAFNKKVAAVDTNIKKVLLSSFHLSPELKEKEIQTLAEKVLPNKNLKDWHYALMDYAKSLPKSIHARYAPKQKQSKFDGSIRQIRGYIIKELTLGHPVTKRSLMKSLNREESDVHHAITELEQEGFITRSRQKILLKK